MRLTLAMLAVLGMCSVANAGAHIWFDATALSPCATVLQEGPGQMTILECGLPPLPPECLFSIDVKVTVDAGGPALGGYDIGLLDVDGVPPCPGFFSDLNGTPPSGWSEDFEVLADRAIHMGGFVGLGTMVPAGTTISVGTFMLHKICGIQGENFVYAGSHDEGYGWFFAGGLDGPLYWGDNDPTDGGPGTWAPFPVIQVNCIPEPATIALLGLGVVGLIRRR